MKKLIAIVCVLAVSLCAFAAAPAEPVFRVDEFGGVFRNEVNTNKDVADYIANNPSEAPLVAGAFLARVVSNREKLATDTASAQAAAAAQIAAKETEKAAAIAAAESAKSAAITAHTSAKASEIETLRAELAAARAELAKLKEAAPEK